MRCDEFTVAYLSGDAGESELRHLAGCSDCEADRPALDAALRLLADSQMWKDPAPQLEEQVVALISGSVSTAETPATSRKQWRTSLVAAMAAAGVVVASLAVWALVRTPGSDWRVSMPGTAEAPAAAAVVEGWNEPSGTRVVLTVTGLAPAPPGSLYEFWFSQENLHVSAGTFTGPGEVEMWVGVSRGAFPRLWVTLEPIDEDETPSGVTVMDTAP